MPSEKSEPQKSIGKILVRAKYVIDFFVYRPSQTPVWEGAPGLSFPRKTLGRSRERTHQIKKRLLRRAAVASFITYNLC